MPKPQTYNTIVLGLGGVGSAALYQLAKRGDKVLGIDQFSPPHQFGSSYGETRITRQAVGEGLQYSPLSLRSYEIFREIEKKSGADLLRITGGLMISSRGSGGMHEVADFYLNCLKAAKEFGIRHDLLDAAEIRKRFPQFRVKNTERAYYEYEAGILFPERCIDVHLKLAESIGAEIHKNEKVKSYSQHQGGVKVVTEGGEYHAGQLVVSAGPWLPQLIGPELASLFHVYRQVQYWFDVEDCYDSFIPGTFPVFIWELGGEASSMYGFPAVDGPSGGFKMGAERYNQIVTPETIDRTVSPAELTNAYEQQVVPYFSEKVRSCIKSRVCLYTSTPDFAFVVDRAPGMPSVLICSPCSGHGFKHTAAIGESIAQIILDGQSQLDLSPFKLDRLLVKS